MTKSPKKYYYLLKHDGYVFKVCVLLPEKVFKKDSQQYFIEFGGKYKCIDITVRNGEETAWLTGIKHHVKCLLNARLQKGQDGTVLMLKAALSFVKERYPFVKRMFLADTSSIHLENQRFVSLISYCILKYNTSWYGKYFDARPENEHDLRALINQLDSTSHKQKYKDYIEFYDKYVSLHSRGIDQNILDTLQKNKAIHKKFLHCHTVREFLLYLDDKYGKQVFQSWLLLPNMYGSTWIIYIDQPAILDFTIEDTDEGFLEKKTQNKVDFMNYVGGFHHILWSE